MAFSRVVTAATTLTSLAAGTYTISVADVTHDGTIYRGTTVGQVNVAASPTPAQVHVDYAISSGSMTLAINGLPQGAPGAVSIIGPGGYSTSLTASVTIHSLTPGTYTVAAMDVTAGSLFVPMAASQQVEIPASAEAVAVSVFYVSTVTSLNVQIQGLTAGVSGAVTVSGPNGYSQSLTSSRVLTGVPAGPYTITASSVSASCSTFAPASPTQTVSVVAGQSSAASVVYSKGIAGLNLCIDGAYITQSVQSRDNAVPLIAGRNGLLRVFVRASEPNSAQPAVRVRFYNGATLVNTVMIAAPSTSVPTAIDEATLGSSWNAPLSGASLQPGLRILVDVDPSNAIAEGNEADNTLPANGSPTALDVRPVSTLNVRLVPVVQLARGDTARVDGSNTADFILPMRRMFPVAAIDVDLRAPYTYTGAALQSGGANWTTLLSEINAVRMTEASGRMYYGVVRVGYTSGVAGLGFIGVPAAIGWDHQPSGTEVMAHEVGHNFGRLHAPCGNPQGVDNQYPYSGATIGAFGYDILTGVVKFPILTDLMSYCDPPWISDYTYKAILNFRAANPMTLAAQAGSSAQGRGTLVWGRIEGGRPVLESGFDVDAPAALPTGGGPNRLEGFGPSGEVLFSFAFAGDRVADSPDPDDQTFAFVVPVSQLRGGASLERLRLSARGRQVEQRRTGASTLPSAQRTAPGRVRVSWNASAARAAMVRDARTGEVLSFGRGGTVDVRTASDDLEVTLSDGVRSVRSRIRPR